ncbi:uncharacterized protein LOC135698161 [Ochlerotatus camptorhynchus]|uniref:uncharacterized protein LOC135698161 n=1 Tax=Ochlerotatus camptorhynchus TaxID=644619 RepID=UPI0031DFDD59
MFKTICILTLTLTSVISVPVESPTDSKGLNRPSPINPDVISDPKPQDVSTSVPPSSPDAGSHIQKIPAKGEKLSSELDQHKQTHKRETTSENAVSKPAFRRDQATSTSTVAPKHSVTTTHEPVSLKTPVVHSSNTKVKREVESSNATTTTRAPVISSSNDDNDNSAPHFVRPVPVEQILKNIHDAPKHHEHSQVVSLHDHETEHVTPSIPTTASPNGDETKTVDDHKVHRVSLHKKNNSDNSKSSEEDKSSEEGNKDQ